MKKKIIFFDGDGTLWYPTKTKYRKIPHWVYKLGGNHKAHNSHLIMTPTSVSTIKKLKKLEILTIILSTHPQQPKEAEIIIKEKIRHFKLKELFDEIIATPDKGFYKHKGRMITKILKKRKIPKTQALMVGDSYKWDYKPAKEVGVEALLIKSHYQKQHPIAKRIKKTITKLSDVLDYV